MMVEKCRLCDEESTNLSPIFSGKLSIEGKSVTCLPIKIQDNNDLPQKICDSCANVIDICYKIILKSMEIDDDFRTRIIKNLENQKTNINDLNSRQMEPQVLMISQNKNRDDSVKKIVVVENEDEKMEIDIDNSVEDNNRFFDEDIKIYCYYEDKEDMKSDIIGNCSFQKFEKTILSEHSYASSALSTTIDTKCNLNNHQVKLEISKSNPSVLRDHNYFRKISDSQFGSNCGKHCSHEMSMDHDYYDKNSSVKTKNCMSSYPCKFYPRAFTSIKQEFMDQTESYSWNLCADVKNENVEGDGEWNDNQRHDFLFVKCEGSV